MCRRDSGDEGGEMKDIIQGAVIVAGVPFLLAFYFPALLAFGKWTFAFFGISAP